MELQEPLNRAHRIQRQAERNILGGRFAEALNCFEKAAEYFGEAVDNLPVTGQQNSYKVSLPLETLLEQKKFCIHQVEILSLKLKQLEIYHQKAMENHCLSNLEIDQRFNEEKSKRNNSNSNNNYLKSTIFQKLDEHDTLLKQLNESNRSEESNVEEDKNKCRQPKSESVIIEELRQCNVELRGFIVKLLEELELKTKELELLRSDTARRSSSSVPTIVNESEACALPELAPLELPDYSIGDVKK